MVKLQNDRKHRDIKLVTAEYKRNKLASEPNYHSTKCISKCNISNGNEKD